MGLNVALNAMTTREHGMTAKPLRAASFLGLNHTQAARLIPSIADLLPLAFPIYEYISNFGTAGSTLLPRPGSGYTEPVAQPVPATRGLRDKSGQPLIDVFMLIYWPVMMTLFVLFAFPFIRLRESPEQPAEEKTPKIADGEEKEDTFELDANIWALNFVSAIGQAEYENGERVTPFFTGAISLFMCSIQYVALGLMIGAIFPGAKPWTTEPASPWLKGENGATVNTMKFLMTIFLAVGQVGEVSQSRRVLSIATSIVGKYEYVCPYYAWIPIVGAFCQYVVAIIVIWGGIATVLSFQTVPDIVYSSMSVVFITSADEMFADALLKVLDIKADFEIPIQPVELPKGGSSEDPYKHQPTWKFLLLKFLQVFPAMLAGQFLLRAWYTGVMPNSRLGM